MIKVILCDDHALIRRGIRDTQRFLDKRPEAPPSLFRIFKTPHWKRLPLLASIWALTWEKISANPVTR